MPVTAPPITALAPEKSATEILAQWLASYFTGQPHNSPLALGTGANAAATRTFALCKILFNQAVLPKGPDKPILHCTFAEWPTEDKWFRNSDLGTWQAVLATPASGVSYGLCDGNVIESVHGARRRVLPGTDIRWVPGVDADEGSLLEQTLQGGTWTTIRTIADCTSLLWVRADTTPGAAYIEETDAFVPVRSITPTNAQGIPWDGALKVVSGRAALVWWVIVEAAGDSPRNEWLCRQIASDLESLFRDPYALLPLQQRGMNRWKVLHAQRNTGTSASQVRWFSTTCDVRYFIPRENVS